MIDKEKQNVFSIRKNELYEECSKLQSELGVYAGYISDLLKLVGECFISAPFANPEASDYIERCSQILSGYSYNANDLLVMLNDYINQSIKDSENEDLKNCVEQSKRLLAGITEKFPTENDILNLKNMIVDCKKIIDHICNQKWPGGESSFSIDAAFALEEHHKHLISLIDRVNYLLDRYVCELSEINKHETSMACVYAPPEIMMGNAPLFTKFEENQVYPFIHSFSGSFSDDKDDTLMEEIYGCPQMIEEYQNSLGRNNSKGKYKFCMHCGNKLSNGNACSLCGKINIDVGPEETVQFCSNCSGTIPIIARYCSYCGNNLRKDTVSDTPESSMACVVCITSNDAVKKQKKEILDKFFKRND